MDEAFERTEARDLASRAPRRDADRPEKEIGGHQQADHADDDGRAQPMQKHFVKIVPLPSGRLLKHALALIGDEDASFDAGRLLKQLLLAYGIRIGIDE